MATWVGTACQPQQEAHPHTEQVACPSSLQPHGALQGTDPHSFLGPRGEQGFPATW